MKSLGSLFEREDWGIMRLTASSRGTYVFDDYKSGDVIRISRLVDGVRQPPEGMGEKVNSDKSDFFASVTPDRRYIMFDRTMAKEGDVTNVDIYWVDAGVIEELRR